MLAKLCNIWQTLRRAALRRCRAMPQAKLRRTVSADLLADTATPLPDTEPYAAALSAFGKTTLREQQPTTIWGSSASGGAALRQEVPSGALLEEALSARRRTLGDTHPETLAAVGTLAHQRYEAGDLPRATVLMAEVVAGRRQLMGPSHHDTLVAVWALAVLQSSVELLAEAAAGLHKAVGARHKHTQQAEMELEIMRRERFYAGAQSEVWSSDSSQTNGLSQDAAAAADKPT